MNSKKFFFLIFLLFPFFLVCLFLLDPDLGWHIKMGEYIIHHGIPPTDPFSYTMSGYPFIDHEWLSNIVTFTLYSLGGKVLLSLIWPFFILGVVLISVGKKWHLWTYPLVLLSLSIILNFSGIRIQIVSWFLIALLFSFYRLPDMWKKYKYYIPLFLIVWVNLHGSFSFALLSLLIFLILKSVQERKVELLDIILFLASVFVTFLNPYGVRIWKEIADQVFDSSPRWFINEWYPAVGIPDIPLWSFVTFSLLLLFRYRKKTKLPVVGIYIVTLLMGTSSVRHMPLWILIALPLANTHINYLYEEFGKIKHAQEKFKKILYGFIILSVFLFSIQTITKVKESIERSESNSYPQKAVLYLRLHPTKGNIFSLNEWGGYLDWKLPQKKVFTDGRMPSWKWNAPLGQSDSAFHEYIALTQNRLPFAYVVKKYNIDTVLIMNPERLKNQKEDIYTYIRWEIDHKSQGSPLYSQIKKLGFKEIYHDDISIIYRTPDIKK